MNIVFKNSTDLELLSELLKNNSDAFEEVYRRYYFMIEKYIVNNSGNKEDARDIFQDMLIALIKAINSSKFKLNKGVKLSSFIHAIVRNIWNVKLRKSKRIQITNDLIDSTIKIDFADIEELKISEKKHLLMVKIFKEISDDCKKLLEAYYFEKIPLKEAAKMFGYTQGFVRVKKNRCMQEFRKRVIKSDEFINLKY